MKEELLSEAARALRDAGVDDDSGRFTRARVMASLHRGRARRRVWLAFALPVGASFVTAGAWATATGKTGRFVEVIERALGVAPRDEAQGPPSPADKGRAHERSRTQAVPGTPAPSVSVSQPIEPAPQSAPLASSPAVSRSPASASAPVVPAPVASAGVVSAPSSAVSPPNDGELGLYRAAHRLHFVEHDAARALHAWDAYLAAVPHGRFALEARYNRALCLVRLGREDEARRALAPFAAGGYGGYRQREATELIDTLSSLRP